MSHLTDFENLIRQLTSPDNNTRGAAEKVYNDNKKFPDQMLGSLMQLIRLSQDDTVKDMCAVLLRRVTLKEGADLSLWERSNPQTHQLVQTELLASLETEKTPRIRNRICDIIADIGAYLVSEGKWPELLPYLFKCTKSAVEEHRISSLWIFGQLTPFISDNLKPYLSVLKSIFFDSLNPAQSLKVRMAGLNASAMFIQSIQDEEDKRLFQDLIPLMIDSLRVILAANQEDEARNAIELFIEIAEIEPSFLRPHIPLVFTAMFTIATTASLEEGTRQLGVEFLVTLAESKPAMVRKLPDYLTRLVPVLLEMMCQLEENPKWNEGEEEDMEDTDADIGEESLDRLALSLRGKTLVPVLFELIRPMINSENWQKRHAALMAISVVGEGCIKFLTPHLVSVVQMVLPRFADPHPRVRWAACNTCGQMSSDFGPEFQSKFHSEILPALASVMNDVENPRVQSHAASAIINFCEHATKSILEPYLDALLTKLMQLLQQGKKIVQEQAITAIAAIADCVDKSFIKYYDGIAPFLKSILANATTKEYRVLRGKAMECISLIGVAVGKEKFMHDAKEVMELLAHSQSKLEPDDPQISFMLQAWARLCRCLGQDFVPYLNVVMPPLMYSASLRPDIRVLQDDEIDETDENWQYIPCDGKNIGIKTSLLEEKSTACNMIFCYAEELKAGFYPYVDEVAKLLVPLMKFYYHDGVRTAAVSTMPCLISSVKLYHQQHNSGDTQQILALWNFMFPVLLESVKAEPDVEVLILIINTISECLESLGPNMLTDVQMNQALETVHSLITDFHQRRTTRTERKADLDFDPEEGEVIEEEDAREEDVLAEIGEICGKLVKYHPQLFLAHLNTILPLLVQLLAPTTPKNDKMVALCIFDDICEHAGPAAIPLYNIFMKTMLESASDADSSLRQSAVFGLGICAMNGGEAFAPFAPETLARLSAVVSAPNSRSDENVHATENAVAAIGRLIQHQPQTLNQSQVLPLWLSHLPVSEDKVESKTTYTHLCHFIENSSTPLFGAQNENLAKVLSVIAQCLETDLIDQVITQRLVAILRKMPSAFPAPVLTAAFKSLPEAHQAKLHKCTA